MTDERPPSGNRATGLAWAGLALGLVGLLGYFGLVLWLGARLPSVRNDALPNWIVVALGLALSVMAFRRAARGRRRLPAALLALNVTVAVALGLFLYVALALPPASGPALGAPAPAFALPDQAGNTVRLESFRGAPLLLVFYRGHW